MTNLQPLFEVMDRVAPVQPAHKLPNYIPQTGLELGVLVLLENGDLSGDVIIRELLPLSKRSRGYGVHYPLLHQMEADGLLKAYNTNDSNRRYYSLTKKGTARSLKLKLEYGLTTTETFQPELHMLFHNVQEFAV